MQEIASVVNLSPPTAASQKPAAKAVSPSCQDSFDTVFKKVSEFKPEKNSFNDQEYRTGSDKLSFENSETQTDTKTNSSQKNEFSRKDMKETSQKTNDNQYTEKSEEVEVEDNQMVNREASIPIDLIAVPIQVQPVIVNSQEFTQTILPEGQLTENNLKLSQSPGVLVPETTIVENETQTNTEQIKNSVNVPLQKIDTQELDPQDTLLPKSEVQSPVLPKGTSNNNVEELNTIDSFAPKATVENVQNQKTTGDLKQSAAVSFDSSNTATINNENVVLKSNSTNTPSVVENVGAYSNTGSTQISEPARMAEAQKSQVISQVTSQLDDMIKTNNSSVRLQLYPEELGHIDLKITSGKDGIGITLIADKGSTTSALTSEANNLRQSIEQNGVQITNLNINNSNASPDQQTFQDRHEFSQHGNNGYQNNPNQDSQHQSHRKISLNQSVIDYAI